MKIKFFPKYSYSGASSRYRTFQYIHYFETAGFKTKIYPFFDDKHIENINLKHTSSVFGNFKYLIRRILKILFLKRCDLLFIEKELIPYFPALFEWYLSKRHITFILDYDDAVIHNYNLSSNRLVRKILSEKIPYIQKKAFAVINGSKYLLNMSMENNARSFYIPTSVNLDRYLLKFNENKNFVIGWIGSVSTSALILPFMNILKEFCKKNNAEVHLVGFDQSLSSTIDLDIFKIIPWKEENEIFEINKFSVGISPSIDTPFARGKCAFKSIQYMACAKPVITSPVGANADVVEHEITGFHAGTPNEWIQYLEFFYANPQIASNMGGEGRKRVEQYFSVQSNFSTYIDIFNSIKR
jgi:glycosyltransferase involved in cell wall biosynthesis